MRYINRGQVMPEMSNQGRPLNGWYPGADPYQFVLYRDSIVVASVTVIDNSWRSTTDDVRYLTAMDAIRAAHIAVMQAA